MEYINETKTVITLPIPLGTTLYTPVTTCGDFCYNHKELFNKYYKSLDNGRCSRELTCHTRLHHIKRFIFELSDINDVIKYFGTWIFTTEEEAEEKAQKLIKERRQTLEKQGFRLDNNGYGIVEDKEGII